MALSIAMNDMPTPPQQQPTTRTIRSRRRSEAAVQRPRALGETDGNHQVDPLNFDVDNEDEVPSGWWSYIKYLYRTWTIPPSAVWKENWDWFVILLVVYNTIMIPVTNISI